MRPPAWHQRVLLVASEHEIIQNVSSAFGPETDLLTAKDSHAALVALEQGAFQVLIVDTSASDPKLHYFEQTKEKVSFLELVQAAMQLNHGLTVVLLANKILLKDGSFARKSGAALIMDRKSISLSRLLYVIRVLRKRTFRTLLLRDLRPGDVLPADLYHFLPANNRYSIFLPQGSELTAEKHEKLSRLGAHHLYVREEGFAGVLSVLLKARGAPPLSQTLSELRDQLQMVMRRLFDISTDGNFNEGKKTFEAGAEIVQKLEELIASYPDPMSCLRELLYPRWSALAHGMNCAVLTLIFGEHCQIAETREIAWAALLHNVGLAEVNQVGLTKSEAELSVDERADYMRHMEKSVELLRQKQIPITPAISDAILYHHETFDGSGFPEGRAGTMLPQGAALLAIAGAYDHLLAQNPGERTRSAKEAWEELLRIHTNATRFGKKFHPELLARIGVMFGRA